MTKNRDKDRKSDTKGQLGSRLLQVREHFGYSHAKMARMLGIMKVTYGKNERGLHLPTTPTVLALHRQLGISAEWFLFGHGPMFWKDVQMEKKPANDLFSGELQEMISLMEHIPLLRHSIMMHYQKFKLDHREVIQEHLFPPPPTPPLEPQS